MTKKAIIQIDVTDWQDEFNRIEPDIHTQEDLFRCLTDDGLSTGQVARLTTVARLLGIAPDDILLPPKVHLYGGARADVAQRISTQKRTVETPSGKEYEVRAYVGVPGRPREFYEEDGDEMAHEVPDFEIAPAYVDMDSTEGLRRAEHYLLNVLPGHIFERFKVVMAASGDVGAAAEDLKAKIDELVGRLT